MTAKRFTLAYETNDQNCIWWAVCDGEITLWKEEVVGLLNELHEERNYFERKKCEYWNKFNLAHLDNINLRKENEQLKSLIKALKKSNTDYVNQIKKAYDEDLSIKELADNCGVDLE